MRALTLSVISKILCYGLVNSYSSHSNVNKYVKQVPNKHYISSKNSENVYVKKIFNLSRNSKSLARNFSRYSDINVKL